MIRFFGYRVWSAKLGTATYVLGVALYALGIMAVFGTVCEQAAAFDELVQRYPEAIMKAVGLTNNPNGCWAACGRTPG